jgi:hypothetical protein
VTGIMAVTEQVSNPLALTGVAAIISSIAAGCMAVLNYKLNQRLEKEQAKNEEARSAEASRQAKLERAQDSLREIIDDGWDVHRELRELAAVAPDCREDDQFVLRAAEALAKLSPFIDVLQKSRRNGALAIIRRYQQTTGKPETKPDLEKLMLHVSRLFLLQSTERANRLDPKRIEKIDRGLDDFKRYLQRMDDYCDGLTRPAAPPS